MPIRTILLAAVLSCTCSAFASEAQQVFDSLYGPRIKAVKASVDRADDHALAKELLTSAGSSMDTPALLVLFCEASYDLSSKHADGFATAAQAMTLLSENVEAQRAAAREKLVEVLTKQSRLGKPEERDGASEQIIDTLLTMGDEKFEQKKWADATSDYRKAVAIATPKKSPKLETIKAMLELTTRRDRSEKQIARLSEKLLGDANDWASAEEIVKLYVVEFEDPKAALPFLNRVKDEQLRKLVPLATKAIGDTDTDACLALGAWYRALAGNGKSASEAALLDRASQYLTRFLEQYSGNDIHRTKAELFQAEITKLLSELPKTSGGGTTAATGRYGKPDNVAIWRTAGELGYPLHIPEKDTLPDELEVKAQPGFIQIFGTCKHDIGDFFNTTCGHFGKIVTIPGHSITGNLSVTVPYRATRTQYHFVFVDKKDKTSRHKLELDANVTYSFRVRKLGHRVAIEVSDSKEKLLEASMPSSDFRAVGFGATVRTPGEDKADLTITWK